jgi:hypothetical protein
LLVTQISICQKQSLGIAQRFLPLSKRTKASRQRGEVKNDGRASGASAAPDSGCNKIKSAFVVVFGLNRTFVPAAANGSKEPSLSFFCAAANVGYCK